MNTFIMFDIIFLLIDVFNYIYYYIKSVKSLHMKHEKKIQEKWRNEQVSNKEASKLFVYHSQYWNQYPILSEDVLRLIHEKVVQDGTVHLWCETCRVPLLRLCCGNFVLEASYKCVDDSYYCTECTNKEDMKIVRLHKRENYILL